MSFVDIVFASLLANNLLFFHFLGLGEFLSEGGSSNLFRRTVVLGLLLVLGVLLFFVPDQFLLQPLHLEFLRTLLLLGVMALLVLSYSAVVGTLPGPWPAARELLVHSLLVAGVVLAGSSSHDLFEVLTAALAVALGYGGALVLLVVAFRRVSRERIPTLFQGLPLQLATLGVIWLVLHGLGFAFAGKAS